MISEINSAIGKKLKHIVKSKPRGNRWLLVFEDNVVCQIRIERGYETCDDEIDDELTFNPALYRRVDLVAAGLFDDD